MKHQKNDILTLFAIPLLTISAQASADYKTDIGYTTLQTELGSATPGGSGVKVTQVEASTGTDLAGDPIFAPDPSVSTMTGKTFSYPGLTCSTPPCTPSVFSGHATGVADRFYGNSLSIAKGISNIQSYEVNQWLNTLNKSNGRATTSDRRIANHSWTGNADSPAETSNILRSVDRQVDLNEYIQVAAATGSPLIGNAYNTISVGLTNGSSLSSIAVDATYVAGRAITDIVAPASAVSNATPIVSAAAALLVETGHQQTDLSLGYRTVGADTVYNAERSETVKAILMAGADRQTSNTSGYGDITDYRSAGHQTDNGLDDRYGAGQVNIYNSYQIMTAGEQNSLQEGGSNGQIDMVGFDYHDFNYTGGSNSDTIASYSFTADTNETLSAALVWNLGVSNNSAMDTTLHHLEISLLDVTDNLTVAVSESMLDNTQNLFWQNLMSGHDYQIQVSSLEGAVNWDYSLAWNRSINAAPVPLPAAFWLFGSALVSLIGFNSKRSAA